MLLGEYEYKVDNKGRLPLPPKLRQEFQNGVVLTRNPQPETCLVLYRKADFEKLAAQKGSKDLLGTSQERMFDRYFFGSAFDLSMDSQGRIALPPALRKFADIEDEVIIVGANNRMELWNPYSWNEAKTKADANAYQALESQNEGKV